MRIAAGRILAECKERVLAGEPGHTHWGRWCADNLTRGRKDADKCIKLFKAPDPAKAAEEARAKDRERKAKSRKKNKKITADVRGIEVVTVTTSPAPQPTNEPTTVGSEAVEGMREAVAHAKGEIELPDRPAPPLTTEGIPARIYELFDELSLNEQQEVLAELKRRYERECLVVPAAFRRGGAGV